uniref:Putative secreted protein n=1 Tax=Anopheles triannulatus TaxID=58253 RepID=A0A2M4B3K2_9DIPT
MRRTGTLLLSPSTTIGSAAGTIATRFVHLFAPIVHHALGILQHLLPPQLEEVVRIGIELQSILSIVPITVELIQRWWFVTSLVNLQHCRRHGGAGEDLLIEHGRTLERLL